MKSRPSTKEVPLPSHRMTSIMTPRPDFLEPLIVSPKTSSPPKSTSSTPRSTSPPPPPSPSPSEIAAAEEMKWYEEYMEKTYYAPARQMAEENLKKYLNDSLPYLLHQRDQLETRRCKFHKMRGWSAEVIEEVEEIDRQLKELESKIAAFDTIEESENETDSDGYPSDYGL